MRQDRPERTTRRAADGLVGTTSPEAKGRGQASTAGPLPAPSGGFRWWHAALFWLLANAMSFRAGWSEDDRRYYEGLDQLPIAPPAGAFVPVWLVNNVSTLWGNLRLLNQPAGTPGRGAQLGLQGTGWLLYATFGLVYFTRRSPILGFIWTAGHWVTTLASTLLALRADRAIALSHATTLAWLTLATALTASQARRNPDALFGYRPGRRGKPSS